MYNVKPTKATGISPRETPWTLIDSEVFPEDLLLKLSLSEMVGQKEGRRVV